MNLYFSSNKLLIILLLFCAFIILSYKVIAQERNVIVESKIGFFNFDSTFISESRILKIYGQGYLHPKESEYDTFDKKRAYYLAKENIWLEIHFSHVLDENFESWVEAVILTKKKLCDEKFQPKISFGPMITSKGVCIGDTISKVIRVYGKPTRRAYIKLDESYQCILKEDLKLTEGQVLGYYLDNPDQLLFAEFYFDKKGLLNSLIISAEE